jgi:hypothetical protein
MYSTEVVHNMHLKFLVLIGYWTIQVCPVPSKRDFVAACEVLCSSLQSLRGNCPSVLVDNSVFETGRVADYAKAIAQRRCAIALTAFKLSSVCVSSAVLIF